MGKGRDRDTQRESVSFAKDEQKDLILRTIIKRLNEKMGDISFKTSSHLIPIGSCVFLVIGT